MTLECHDIDQTTGQAAIAYRGAAPWHKLGQAIAPGDSINTITKKAGLAYAVEKTPVLYKVGDQLKEHTGRFVLHRNDTGAALGIMSKGYKVVQPKDIMSFFKELGERGGFEIETAGALRGGAKVWALAKIGEAVEILSGDAVLPYLLLATSFDGSLSTTGKFTAVRVVCRNTISMALEREERGRVVKVPHHALFDPANVRDQLGIAMDSWGAWLKSAKSLAAKPMSGADADDFLTQLLAKPRQAIEDTRESTGYRNVMALFEGGAIGSDLTQGRTAWQMLGAVTEYVDHHRGNTDDTRMNSAWFGSGSALKTRAYELLTV